MTYIEQWSREVPTSQERAWAAIRSHGGTGFGLTSLAWQVRGTADRALDRLPLVGADGPRPVWAEESVEPDESVHLRARSRLPGEARLELRMDPAGVPGRWRLTQRSSFRPAGLLGRAYWYALLPAHRLVFRRMFEDLVDAATRDT